MSRKKKRLFQWGTQWWEVSTYHPVGFFRRKVFFVRAKSYQKAHAKVMRRYPSASILCTTPLGS